MALQPLMPDDPSQQQENPLIAQLRALSSQQAPAAPTQSMGGAPSLPTNTLKPLVTSPKLAQEQKLQNSISQFENPTKPQGFWQNLRHDAATVGNIAGDVALGERTMSGIPGTAAYHQALHDKNVQELAGLQQGDRADENQASENTLRAAETGEAQAKTKALENPADKPDAAEFQQTDHGLMRIDKVTGKAEPVTYNGQPLKPADKPTTDKPDSIDQQYIDEYQKLHPGSTVAQAVHQLHADTQAPQRTPVVNMFVPGANGQETLQTVHPGQSVGPGARTAAGVNTVNTPTTQMRNASAQAQLVVDQVPSTLAEIDRLHDQLGPVMGRWNEFMQGKVGADNPEFAGLRADLLMMSSAVALAHARGRLPENLREEFNGIINNPKQTPENLKATLTHVGAWMQKNADAFSGNQGQQQGGGEAPPPGAKVRDYTSLSK